MKQDENISKIIYLERKGRRQRVNSVFIDVTEEQSSSATTMYNSEWGFRLFRSFVWFFFRRREMSLLVFNRRRRTDQFPRDLRHFEASVSTLGSRPSCSSPTLAKPDVDWKRNVQTNGISHVRLGMSMDATRANTGHAVFQSTPKSPKMRWRNGRTDGWTDARTDGPSYRGAL